MKEKLFDENQGLSYRKQFLESNCQEEVEKSYMRRLTSDQLAQMKDQLSEQAIAINEIEEQKKEAMKLVKETLKPLIEKKKTLLQNLKNKAESVNETVYKFVYPETRMVGFYNVDGELIESRPAFADEFQGKLFVVPKTGTND